MEAKDLMYMRRIFAVAEESDHGLQGVTELRVGEHRCSERESRPA